MIETLPHFIQEAKKGMADKSHREQMNLTISRFMGSFQKSAKQFPNLELAKMRAARLRWKTINHLDKYLIEFESNFIKSGGKVIWAKDMDEVTTSIDNILSKGNVNSLMYDSGRHTGELSLSESFQNGVLKVTDLYNIPRAENSTASNSADIAG